jgi:hypothetical protein
LEVTWPAKAGIFRDLKHAFMGWTGMTSQADASSTDRLEIDPTFASTIGLEIQQKVRKAFPKMLITVC